MWTQVKLKGGSVQYGWLLWQCQEYLLDGEFHAVWRDSSGILRDITPSVNNSKVIFLEVSNMPLLPARLRHNRRMPLTPDPLVHRYIELATIRDLGYLSKKGTQCTMAELNHLFYPTYIAYTLLQTRGNLNSNCLCGSGSKFKNCHGKAPPRVI